MRLTRLGLGCVFLAGLTLMSAATTGNNLLYLVYGAMLGALVLSWLLGRANLRAVSARAAAPDQVFQDADFPLTVVLRNEGRWPAFALSAACRGRREGVERIEAGGEAAFSVRYVFPHRGVNRIDDLVLESSFPLGLIRHRRALPGAEGFALPRLHEVRSPAEVRADATLSGSPVIRKGSGDELYGVREHSPEDDSRLINWKLTAKTGRPVVAEYCSAEDSKVTVRLDVLGEGAAAERRITEAASACRFYIDAGAEVKLITPEGQEDYGRGLLHLDKLLRRLAGLGEGKVPRPAGAALSPPPSGLSDTPALRRLTFAGAALVYASLFLVEEVSPALLAAFAPALPLGWFVYEKNGPRLPPWFWRAASLLTLGYILLVDWRVSGLTIANAHLMLYLLVNRALSDLRAEELGETFLILFLAFFLASGLTISLWYFVFFLLYLAFAAAWLMLASGARPESARRWAPALGGVLLGTLALTAVAFAATPRVEGLRRMNPFVVSGIDKLQVKTSAVVGFTDNVSLGFFGELKRSTARVMRVRPGASPSGARPAALRIRGSAFDSFDGRRWSKTKADFSYRSGRRAHSTMLGSAWLRRWGERLVFPGPAEPAELSYDFVIYPMTLSVAFTVGTPAELKGVPDAAYFDHTDSVYFAGPYAGGTHYVISSRPGPIGFSREIAGYAKLLRERYLQRPEPADPRLGELARRITAKAGDDLAKAKAVELYLRRSYSYSTFMDAKGRTLEDFLFKGRKGNCEYFASAGVMLLRAAGVPARLVSGFYSDEWNEFGRFFDVRQGQAHAWLEAYVAGRGWLTFDPTPPQTAFAAGADVLSRRLQRWFDAVQVNWYRHVIGYDQYVQRNTFLRLGLNLSTEALSLWVRRLAVLVGSVLLALWLWSGLPALRRLRGAEDDFFPRAQAVLERAGLPREPCLTAREYARSVAERRPELAGIMALAELHYLQRYSPRGLDAERLEEARRGVKELKEKAL